MNRDQSVSRKGFTLLELLVVIAIIGILSAVVLASLSNSREKGRDAARKSQTQEILKALELYFTDHAGYPTFEGGGVDTGGFLSTIDTAFYGTGTYLNRLPDEADSRYYYCVSADRKTIVLSVDTEQDGAGGSEFCSIQRGVGSAGCDVWVTANASDNCSLRF